MKILSIKQRFWYQIGANTIFAIHLLLVILVVFGWLLDSLFYVFLFALFATFLSEVLLGYCFLSKWEFYIRRRIDPSRNFDKSCIGHYFRLFFGLKPRVLVENKKTFFKKYSFIFCLFILFCIGTFFHFI